MGVETIVAKLIESTEDKVVFLYDADLLFDQMTKSKSGIVEFDYCVFDSVASEVGAAFILQNLSNNHIRIIQEPKIKDINDYGIDTIPFTIFREILNKYYHTNHIPGFAVYFSKCFLEQALQVDIVREMFIKKNVASEETINDLLGIKKSDKEYH